MEIKRSPVAGDLICIFGLPCADLLNDHGTSESYDRSAYYCESRIAVGSGGFSRSPEGIQISGDSDLDVFEPDEGVVPPRGTPWVFSSWRQM